MRRAGNTRQVNSSNGVHSPFSEEPWASRMGVAANTAAPP